MNKLNNKGFTLIELLAVVVILGVLSAITVPTVTSLINKNKEDNYESLKKSILSAAKIYISENRYNITLDSTTCNDVNKTRNISTINASNDMFIENESGKLKVSVLIDSGDLNDGRETIINPKNNNQKLDLDNSYVIVKYNCNTKDYDYTIDNNYLVWEDK